MKNIFFLFLCGICLLQNINAKESRSPSIETNPSTLINSMRQSPESSQRFSPFTQMPIEQDMEKVFKAFKKALFLTSIELMANNPKAVKNYCKNLTSGSTLMKTVGALACSPVQNNSLGILEIVINYLANYIYYPLKESFYISKKVKDTHRMGLSQNQDTLKQYKTTFYEEEYKYWYDEDTKLMLEAEKEFMNKNPKMKRRNTKIEKSLESAFSYASNVGKTLTSPVTNTVSNIFSIKTKNRSGSSASSTSDASSRSSSPQTSDDDTDSALSDQDLAEIREESRNILESGENTYAKNYFAVFVQNLKEQWKIYQIKEEPAHFFQIMRDSFKEVVKRMMNNESDKYQSYLGQQQEAWYDWLSGYKVGFVASSIPIQAVAGFFSTQVQKIIHYAVGHLIDNLYSMIQSKCEEMANHNPNIQQKEVMIGQNAEFFDVYGSSFEMLWSTQNVTA